MPLRKVEGLAVGDVLPLAGISVGSVRLEGPDGASVTTARLGQAMGLRAVRLELAAPNELREVKLVEPPAPSGLPVQTDTAQAGAAARIARTEQVAQG